MKPHVLIVDDSPTVRMDLRATLNFAGFTVTACDTKASAQQALRSRAYDLIILDVILPDGNGIDLLREIRSTQEHEHLPVILLSTEANVRDRIRGLTTGAADYIGKPYDSDYLVRRACELALAHELGPSSAPQSVRGKKILVVDDSLTYLQTMADLLRRDGHDVVLAQSGEEALELLAVTAVDGILLDFLMPGIDGLETCRRIRRDPRLQNVPILMLTGRDDNNARREGIEAGADEFALKSPALEHVRVRLRALLRRRRPSTHSPSSPELEEAAPSTVGSRRATAKANEANAGKLDSLFSQAVAASGLSHVIGPSTIERACKRAGVDARTMSPADLERALPALRDTLSMFLTRDETERRVAALAALAGVARASERSPRESSPESNKAEVSPRLRAFLPKRG